MSVSNIRYFSFLYFIDDNTCNLNVNVKCESADVVLSFLFHSPGSSDKASLNQERKNVSQKLEIWKNKHITAD